ncbi:MAG: hypothetical protein LR005_02320 [Candidatus Pacebacteria bacterium]|nr:hypothetical protein [Candidatus Paceibacterota bacterium]
MNKKQKIKRRIILGMLLSIVISFTSYSYAIASTTLSASSMELKNDKISELETEIAELETKYFDIVNVIVMGIPDNYNLVSVGDIAYVDVKGDSKVAYNSR